MFKKATQSFGRRGLLLVLSGLAWVLMGVDNARHDAHRFTADQLQLHYNPILAFMNLPGWGWLWIACGGLAVLVGVFRQSKWLHGRDDVGFNLILLPSVVWMMFYGWSWGVGLYTHGQEGRPESFYGVVVWALVVAFIMVCAGWPEPPRSLSVLEATHPDHHPESEPPG